jgi:hypothetical protein
VRDQTHPALRAPSQKTLKQIAVGATDIQDITVARHRIQQWLAFRTPALASSAEPGCPNRIRLAKIRLFKRIQSLEEL